MPGPDSGTDPSGPHLGSQPVSQESARSGAAVISSSLAHIAGDTSTGTNKVPAKTSSPNAVFPCAGVTTTSTSRPTPGVGVPDGLLASARRILVLTAAHHALAQWQARRGEHGAAITFITTNVDDFHERAGGAVHHLHGNLFSSVCLDADCGGRLDNDVRGDGRPTPCPRCGMRCRPDVVLFGEPVDLDALWQAKRAVRDCEVFLAIGTSSSVYPASGLVRYARDVGAYSILVNPAHDAGAGFDQHVALPADVAVPALLAPLL